MSALRRSLLVLVLCALAAPIAAFAGDDDPVVTVPADFTVEAQNFSGAPVTYAASAVDRRGRAIPVTCTPASGSGFGFGRTTVACTARDSENRTTTKTFHITVADRTPPVISLPPSPKQVRTHNRAGTVVTYTGSSTDVVDGGVPINCAPGSGTFFPVGTTKVTCSATDRRGNTSSAVFDVLVTFEAVRKRTAAALFWPRSGARITTPPMLRWRAPSKARFYNVQLYRRGHKILSVWPSRSGLRLRARWTFKGRSYRFKPGNYTWLVWPAYGRPSHPRFGKLLGQSTFQVAR